ncbi:hypothetical protein T03_616 [Trichinella britovi]|uniref:Uncharacterized protein n=1 Tax=Trichinella britovi TaxID=45882 RepID=A0A0V1C5J0_TRIBR|nr:hypothetical protein T03_616 [Trichinella britovi]
MYEEESWYRRSSRDKPVPLSTYWLLTALFYWAVKRSYWFS